MDSILIRNLEVFANHGVHPEEKVLGQKFLLDAVLTLDLADAGDSDALEDSVSYGDVIRLLRKEMLRHNDQLLERVAGRLAEVVLLTFPSLKKVELTLKKPWAPVMMHIDHVAVRIERGWHKVYVSAGSNIGDRKGWLDFALDRLMGERKIRLVRSAAYIETDPWGYEEQDPFLNTVFEFETMFLPEKLLTFLQGIEAEAGRTREIHWGPRTLDLDILLYDDLVTEDEKLVIPHPLMNERLFVLDPLVELLPYGVHPLTRERFLNIRDKLTLLSDKEVKEQQNSQMTVPPVLS